ncbi:M15 family metallopeptidase [Methylocapsa acidiphila]|uniref:M15 family metallopeptidase n=1 Tax=Methylocapsa acidiphila TaxID=133552 RepID=UPI0004163BC2|nr:M15 family metallopeptidase [Methylocapsa acidiphila]
MSEAYSAALTLLMLSAVCAGAARGQEPPKDFVRLADLAPGIKQDIRYAGADNFMGRPVPGYVAPQCWLRREVAEALAAAQREAEQDGLGLIVYDCYRPQKATKAFIAWAQDSSDQAMKPIYYPNVDKTALFELGYIAKASAHSTGLAVDLGIVGLDFGTPFDLFDAASATDNPDIEAAARANRVKLFALMQRHGFSNLPQEWWHFALEGVKDAPPWDFDVKE